MRTFTKLGSVLFGLMALLHALRLAYGWEAVFAGWTVPLWLSAVGLAVATVMAWGLWKESK